MSEADWVNGRMVGLAQGDTEAQALRRDIERLEGKVLALKIGLEQLRGADVSEHVRNHIESVLESVSLGQT